VTWKYLSIDLDFQTTNTETEINLEFAKYVEKLNTENIYGTDGAKRSTGAGWELLTLTTKSVGK